MPNTLEMKVLTPDEIRKATPQAYATSPKPGVSAKYSFLPTSRIIDDMDTLGWKVCSAKGGKYRNGVNAEFGNHVIKFFHPEIFIRDTAGDIEAYPNVVVMNSHTGRGSFKFEMGIFRLVCENGLIIKDKDMGGFQLRHSGYSFEELQKTLGEAVDRLPDVVGRINTFSQVIMTAEQQHEFAQKAFQLRAGEERLLSEAEIAIRKGRTPISNINPIVDDITVKKLSVVEGEGNVNFFPNPKVKKGAEATLETYPKDFIMLCSQFASETIADQMKQLTEAQ